MSEVRIGDVKVGSIQHTVFQERHEYHVYRVGIEKDVHVGRSPDRTQALNMLARSLIAKSLETTGVLNPTQRQNIANINGQLRAFGLDDLARSIEEALKP